MVESFKVGVDEGLKKARELCADGVQIYITGGPVQPHFMDGEARIAFRKRLESMGLVISALCADYGHGFTDPTRNDDLIARTKECVDLARDLGVYTITTHIGALPPDRKDPAWQACYQAVCVLAFYAEKRGVCLATETGPESCEELRDFLDAVSSPGAKVNYDPANLVMNGYDHLGGVKTLAPYIVHTHAKDGIRRADGSPEEVPLGEGTVDFPSYLSCLDNIGFDGFLAIEREVGDNPEGDIANALEFLRKVG